MKGGACVKSGPQAALRTVEPSIGTYSQGDVALDRPALRSREIKALALDAGFDAVGIAAAHPFPAARSYLLRRIATGVFDGMPWFNAARAEVAGDPRNLLPD